MPAKHHPLRHADQGAKGTTYNRAREGFAKRSAEAFPQRETRKEPGIRCGHPAQPEAPAGKFSLAVKERGEQSILLRRPSDGRSAAGRLTG